MSQKARKTVPLDVKKSVQRAQKQRTTKKSWEIDAQGQTYAWSNNMERVDIIRKGIPYASIETISNRINRPVKTVLSIVGVPQTTYNKKKGENSLLDSKESELVVRITELIDYGIEVFNNEEEKFQRWLRKPNVSLGSNTPESLLDTTTGIDEVKFALNRIEFGNFA